MFEKWESDLDDSLVPVELKFICSKCHEEKKATEFYSSVLKIYCRTCQKLYTKGYLKTKKGKALRAKAQRRYRKKLKEKKTHELT